jgi:vacuolar-type H+-ATPase subunit H
MNLENDSEVEMDRIFDERISIARNRRPLSNVTNKSVAGDANRPRNVFAEALSNPTLYYSYNAAGSKRRGGKDGGCIEHENEAGMKNRETRIKFVEPGAEELDAAKVVEEPGAMSDVGDGEAEKHSVLLAKIQREFDELKEAHRKALEVRRRLIRALEKEMAEYKKRIRASAEKKIEEIKKEHSDAVREKNMEIERLSKQVAEGGLDQRLESLRGIASTKDAEIRDLKERCAELREKRKQEMEDLRKEYDARLSSKKEEYKDLCKKRIMQYREMVDGFYREKASEYRSKCSERLKRIKNSYRSR